MRLRLRLRAALFSVALVALALLLAMELWRGGAFAFQREHAEIARDHARSRRHYANKLSYCRVLAAAYPPGSLIPENMRSTPEGILAKVAEMEEKVRAEEAAMAWHARIAGPSYAWWIDDGGSSK